MKILLLFIFNLIVIMGQSQQKWEDAGPLFGPLPPGIGLYFTDDSLDGKPFRAFYASIDLKDKNLQFTVDTGLNRGLTPLQYYKRNSQPFLVVNCTFFSGSKRNLNVVVKDRQLLAGNVPWVFDAKDSLFHYLSRSALGISRHRRASVEWVVTDTVRKMVFRTLKGPVTATGKTIYRSTGQQISNDRDIHFKKWRPEVAVGGGPNLLSRGKIDITNNEERMFAGARINEKHPRTAMGYTRDKKLVILVIEGRFPGKAEGATLEQEARLLLNIGCVEALNLDGGGSSCLLVNGKQTITPCDKTGQRPVPAVFMIKPAPAQQSPRPF